MKIQSDRLTLRGVHPSLKHALYLRCQKEKISIEKLVIQILEKELAQELKMTEIIKKITDRLPAG